MRGAPQTCQAVRARVGLRIANLVSRLVEFEDLGHSPQVEAPARFNAALLEALE